MNKGFNIVPVPFMCAYFLAVVTSTALVTVASLFDDGDKRTLRRTQLVLKGERHFKETYSRAGKRKQAAADASLLSLSRTLSSSSPHPINNSPLVDPSLRTDNTVLRATRARHMAPTSSGISKSIFKPRHPVYLAAFNVRTLKQARQRGALTLDLLVIDVCCVPETRIQDTSSSLDSLPLTNPEQFRQPVIDRKKHRSNEDDANEEDEDECSSEEQDDDERKRKAISKVSETSGCPILDTKSPSVLSEDHCPGASTGSAPELHPEPDSSLLSESHVASQSLATEERSSNKPECRLSVPYQRLIGRLVLVNMPLSHKDTIPSPSNSTGNVSVSSSEALARRRFTPALVVLPSAMPSIDLRLPGSGKLAKVPNLLVRSFKDNRFFPVPLCYMKRLKRPSAVELAHSHPSLRNAFERALLWLDRYELPAPWGETAMQTLLGTKNWRATKRQYKASLSESVRSTEAVKSKSKKKPSCSQVSWDSSDEDAAVQTPTSSVGISRNRFSVRQNTSTPKKVTDSKGKAIDIRKRSRPSDGAITSRVARKLEAKQREEESSSSSSPSDSDSSSSVDFEARDRWIAQLYRFMDEGGAPINKAPSLANKDLDLLGQPGTLALLSASMASGNRKGLVRAHGGFHRVTAQLKWGYIYSKLGLPHNFAAGPRNLQAAFKRYLYPLDDISRKLGTDLDELPLARPRHLSSNSGSAMRSFIGSARAVTISTPKPSTTEAKTSDSKGNAAKMVPHTAKEAVVSCSEAPPPEQTSEPAVECSPPVLSPPVLGRTPSPPADHWISSALDTTATPLRSVRKQITSQQSTKEQSGKTLDVSGARANRKAKEAKHTPAVATQDKAVKTTVDATSEPRVVTPLSTSSSFADSCKSNSQSERTKHDFPHQPLFLQLPDDLARFNDNCEMSKLNQIIPIGSRVRVRCGDRVAYEAKVLKHIRPQPGLVARGGKESSLPASWTCPTETQYRVHYMGWNTRHDEVVSRSRIISIVEWARPPDSDRPPSCSSLNLVVQEPPRRSHAAVSGDSKSGSRVAARDQGRDKSGPNRDTEQKEREDDQGSSEVEQEEEEVESDQSQTTETASDIVTTTAPMIRRRRMMFDKDDRLHKRSRLKSRISSTQVTLKRTLLPVAELKRSTNKHNAVSKEASLPSAKLEQHTVTSKTSQRTTRPSLPSVPSSKRPRLAPDTDDGEKEQQPVRPASLDLKEPKVSRPKTSETKSVKPEEKSSVDDTTKESKSKAADRYSANSRELVSKTIREGSRTKPDRIPAVHKRPSSLARTKLGSLKSRLPLKRTPLTKTPAARVPDRSRSRSSSSDSNRTSSSSNVSRSYPSAANNRTSGSKKIVGDKENTPQSDASAKKKAIQGTPIVERKMGTTVKVDKPEITTPKVQKTVPLDTRKTSQRTTRPSLPSVPSSKRPRLAPDTDDGEKEQQPVRPASLDLKEPKVSRPKTSETKSVKPEEKSSVDDTTKESKSKAADRYSANSRELVSKTIREGSRTKPDRIPAVHKRPSSLARTKLGSLKSRLPLKRTPLTKPPAARVPDRSRSRSSSSDSNRTSSSNVSRSYPSAANNRTSGSKKIVGDKENTPQSDASAKKKAIQGTPIVERKMGTTVKVDKPEITTPRVQKTAPLDTRKLAKLIAGSAKEKTPFKRKVDRGTPDNNTSKLARKLATHKPAVTATLQNQKHKFPSTKALAKADGEKTNAATLKSQQRTLTKADSSSSDESGVSDKDSKSRENSSSIRRTSTISQRRCGSLSVKKRTTGSRLSQTKPRVIAESSASVSSNDEGKRKSTASIEDSDVASSESDFGAMDALPRLTRSQHRQLLGDTPPGAALQTASPVVSTATAGVATSTAIGSPATSSESHTKTSVPTTNSRISDLKVDVTEDNQFPEAGAALVTEVKEENVWAETVDSHEVLPSGTPVSSPVLSTSNEPLMETKHQLKPEDEDTLVVLDQDDKPKRLAKLRPRTKTVNNEVTVESKELTEAKNSVLSKSESTDKVDDDDERSSVHTMSTDPMKDLLFDFTMSPSEESVATSSAPSEEGVDVNHVKPSRKSMRSTQKELSDSNDEELSQPQNDEAEENSEEGGDLAKSLTVNSTGAVEVDSVIRASPNAKLRTRSERVRHISTSSSTADGTGRKTPAKRGSGTPLRTAAFDRSPTPASESPHYSRSPIPSSGAPTSVCGSGPSAMKSAVGLAPPPSRLGSSRRFGGPFFPIAGFEEMSSETKCQLLQERMQRILEAWRSAKQYLKDLDQRTNRSRRIRARQSVTEPPPAATAPQTSMRQCNAEEIQKQDESFSDVTVTEGPPERAAAVHFP
ncbi:hypothetical protein T265_11252 [Opisthorchis viverrini]|uniref:ARID domain-containing protein n=1 Tax=Opisthorchis viverrini TaxID=6198 RepID=A0A074YZM9_OPIVI|nr:hypothetical protein T265_11252 [Opisthorchis viverrini]KER20133.1 hypothetical protein T265_11252 [Opisthorchis viverrini]